MTTDTPRTDAARFEALRGLALRQDCIPLKLGQELERELKRANDEIEFYEKVGQEKVDELRASNAEVERLREQLQQAVDIAEWYMDYLVSSPRKDKLDAIKATLNPVTEESSAAQL